MHHTDTSRSQIVCHILLDMMPEKNSKKSYIIPCLPQATNRTFCHALSQPQITGNKPYFLPCLTHVPAQHRQHIVHLILPPIDTSKSQTTNRT